jgi:hypothetical protein|tara:strand:- start:2879 stop:3076 length:198 start_codon:yes stop_codon:yes gene_type:complete
MEAATLRENFTQQFNSAIEEIKNLQAQVEAKKELALKLKGALEAIDLMDPPEETVEPEVATPEVE